MSRYQRSLAVQCRADAGVVKLVNTADLKSAGE